jgi:hypothetical protein
MIDPLANLRLEVETTPPAGKSKNLIKNPDGVFGGSFWVTPAGGTVDSSPTYDDGFGNKFTRVRYTHAAAATGFRSERLAVTAGQYVTARYTFDYAGNAAGTVPVTNFFLTPSVIFENAAGAVVGTSTGATQAPAPVALPPYTPGTERLIGPYLAPAGTVTARLSFAPSGAGATAGQVAEIAGVGLIARAASGAVTWATDAVQAGATWLNILGPTVEIEVERRDLDLGTLTATIRDATLDPLVAATIRPGRECRLMALSVTSLWEPVFTGEVADFEVEYEAEVLAKNPSDPKHCRIELEAADRTRTLASVRRPEGVSTLADLRDTLEDSGVPWEINGNKAHLLTAPTIVSRNDNATALDQIALTRDSRQALAWLDRRGIMQVWDRANLAPFNNVSIAVDLAGWTGTASTRTRVASPTFTTEAGAMQMVATGTGAMTATTDLAIAPRRLPGHTYVVQLRVRPSAATSRTAEITLRWLNKDRVEVFTTGLGSPAALTAGAWTVLSSGSSFFAEPNDVRYVAVEVKFNAGAAGETMYVDDLTGINAEVVLDQAKWSKIEVGGGSKRIINEVWVDYLRPPLVAGESSEVIPYGPFRDEASVAAYGVRSRKFTIHGTNEATDPTNVANVVLAANAVPKPGASSCTFAVKSTADLSVVKALADLQQTAQVSFATKAYADRLRIASIRHTIVADPQYRTRWNVTYGFTSTSTVASPRVIPEPPSGGALALADTAWIPLGLASGWGNYGSTWEQAAYRRLNGVVYIRGLLVNNSGVTRNGGNVIATLPAGFRSGTDQHLAVGGINGTAGVVNIMSNGNIQVNTAVGPGQWLSIRINPYPADQ